MFVDNFLEMGEPHKHFEACAVKCNQVVNNFKVSFLNLFINTGWQQTQYLS